MINVPLHYMTPKIDLRPSPMTGSLAAYAAEPIYAGELVSIWGGYIVSAEKIRAYYEIGDQIHGSPS